MGAKLSRSDFEWVGSDEPHATRRKLILAKHPDIKNLMKVDPYFKWTVVLIVIIQITTLILIKDVTSLWVYFIISYMLTASLNQTITLAVHEISHCQAFGYNHITANRLFGMFANLPLGVPMSISFKKYHLEHHRYQGDDVKDTDIPSKFETKYFNTTLTKCLWVLLQPFFYSFRPFFVYPKPIDFFEVINALVQLAFDVFIGMTLGWHLVVYMIFSTFIGMGYHPLAGHFISEHYIMFPQSEKRKNEKGELVAFSPEDGHFLIPETCSYYGPLNWIAFNVGYHVEHHDFPSIPATLLPKVRQIAPEFYNNLYHHTSWVKVIYQFIFDPKVGPYARVKRRITLIDKLKNQ